MKERGENGEEMKLGFGIFKKTKRKKKTKERGEEKIEKKWG